MLEFLVGVSCGIWIGTMYNCKPYLEIVMHIIKNNIKALDNDSSQKAKGEKTD
jgi:hypothetical protein